MDFLRVGANDSRWCAPVFDLLRAGQLRAPSLHTEALSPHALVEPIP
jgi:hypothetical protein